MDLIAIWAKIWIVLVVIWIVGFEIGFVIRGRIENKKEA